eukprot:CAMPEP_0176252830 /NCGR_PEP_ID=MMETSP0121_2-20121125/35705_1 /TAXON_ID=160619 /ORGANISM="Kryptoperidinium foliaceum, Strain CCMP 1326" /LENGTH=88 /DNA_ID=CAMNT_0017592593 /DNA_START=35 /DNA_END=299 /DNA_ORIENTATION=-
MADEFAANGAAPEKALTSCLGARCWHAGQTSEQFARGAVQRGRARESVHVVSRRALLARGANTIAARHKPWDATPNPEGSGTLFLDSE